MLFWYVHLAQRTDFSVSTKNKYLATAKIFLKELNRQGILPIDITQNIKTFNQNKKHKKDGLTHSEIENLVEKRCITSLKFYLSNSGDFPAKM